MYLTDLLKTIFVSDSKEAFVRTASAAMAEMISETVGQELNKNDSNYVQREFIQALISKSIEADERFKGRLCYTREDYEALCKDNPAGNVHWLSPVGSGTLVWCNSQQSTSELRQHFDEASPQRHGSFSEQDLVANKGENKVTVISDVAGMGKSTVMTSIAAEMKRSYPDSWIIRVDLNDCTKALSCELERQKSNKPSFSSNNPSRAVEFLVNELIGSLENLKTEALLEQSRFQFGLRNQKVIVLLDGFDEICPDYKRIGLDLLKALKNANLQRLVVTTRPAYKRVLEDNLGVLALELKPLTKQQRKDCLTKSWLQRLPKQPNGVLVRRANIYASDLLELFDRATKTWADKRAFSSIPLHIMMLGEVYFSNQSLRESGWQDCQEFIHSDQVGPKPRLPKNLDVSDLYEGFLETKFFNIYLEQKKGTDISKPDSRKSFQDGYKKFKRNHEVLAMYSILELQEFKDFFPRKSSKVISDQNLIKRFHGFGVTVESHASFIKVLLNIWPLVL